LIGIKCRTKNKLDRTGSLLLKILGVWKQPKLIQLFAAHQARIS